MELTFTPLRVIVFVILLAAFALLGGFAIPEGLPSRGVRSWGLSILLFVAGAVSATMVDHWIGNLERSNLRWFYVVIGLAGMAGATLIQHVLVESLPGG